MPLNVETYKVVKLPMGGPGEGQRDAWSAHVEVKQFGSKLRFEGTGFPRPWAECELADLKQLVEHFDA